MLHTQRHFLDHSAVSADNLQAHNFCQTAGMLTEQIDCTIKRNDPVLHVIHYSVLAHLVLSI